MRRWRRFGGGRHALFFCALAGALACGGCGSGGDDAGAVVTPAPSVRDARYCEILLAFVSVSGSAVHVDVYNSFGLNECPDAAWNAVDASAVKTTFGATQVILNGPRHWVIDAFANSAFVDATPVAIGGIEMRKAGAIELTLAELAASGPYAPRDIERTTTYVFEAGHAVHELVAPDARVYVMQSYSLEHRALTEAALDGLGATLVLPSGWSYRTRVPEAALLVTAVGGIATIVQDDLENTYQLAVTP